MKRLLTAFLLCATALHAQDLIRVRAKTVALVHVKIIDGTGAPPRSDQTVILRNGLIAATGNTADVAIPADAERLDLAGYTVIPGLVGMHEHLFYPAFPRRGLYTEHAFSFPRLYLASGVTTARTAGGFEVQTDLMIKKWIDQDRWVGPQMLITAGYLEGPGSFTPNLLEMRDAGDATAFVEFWARMGATSFKAYMHVTRAELKAAIDTAHARGLKVTGHLCSVGFREAAALGIDNLEHGLVEDTEFLPGKQPDQCPNMRESDLAALDIQGSVVQQTIRELVQHNVAITSTPAVFENAPPVGARFLEALSEPTRAEFLKARARISDAAKASSAMRVNKEIEFERAFVKAGGLLMAGADPTGNGSALAGFADQRNIELLVAGGFTPVEAIRIATLNGAKFLGMESRIGSIEAGKRADLVVLDGDLEANISAIENTPIVFKDGVGYDSAKLLESVRGSVGIQ